jgi:proton-coupled amino acid transporter
MIHYKACAKTRKEKVADIALMIFGLIAALYTTVQTIRVSPLVLHLDRPCSPTA